MRQFYLFLLILSFNYYAFSQSRWPSELSSIDRIQELLLSRMSPVDNRYSTVPCRNCFRFQMYASGRRMLVEPCGDENCVPIINNTHLDEYHLPTQYYDFNKCGLVDNTRRSNKPEVVLKVSTSVNNTLRTNEFPWLVRIEGHSSRSSQTVTLCGGTLIHPQWIITAAHCMFDSKTSRPYQASGIHLYMGHYDRSRTSKQEYVKKAALYLIHPNFTLSRYSSGPIHDIALIKLARPVPLSNSINVACLPESTDQIKDGALAFTAGWGHVSPESGAVNLPRRARIRISPRACGQLMIDKKVHICGRSVRGHNICSGDSGSGLLIRPGIPTVQNGTEWKWHVFGVASFGLDECSRDINHDNAFASVPAEVDWIRTMMTTY